MNYIYYFFCVILLIPVALLSTIFGIIPGSFFKLIGKKERSRKIYLAWARVLAKSVLVVLNYKVHITGLENFPKEKKNLAFISNHLSIIDLCVYYGKLDVKAAAVAKKEVEKVPFLKQFVHGMGCILLDRKSPKSSIKAILDATNELKKGGQVLIFPEGTRSKTGQIGSLKAGSYKMAVRAKSTIVPLVIKGSRSGFEDLKRLGRHHVYVEVLPSVSADNLTKEEEKELPEIISASIVKKYNEMQVIKK